MSSNLTIFQQGDFSFRSITDKDGKIWIVAKDIAQSLGYNLNGGMNRIFGHVPTQWAKGKRIAVRSENGVEQEREMLCLTEQGLYFFLGRSDKRAALPYQIWVADKVIPSIRRSGFYATPATAEKIINDPDAFIKVLEALKAEREKALTLETKNIQLEAKIEENKPKVMVAEALDVSQSAIDIGTFAKILRQNGVNIGQKRLFQWFRGNGWLMNSSSGWNLPTQKAINRGFFVIKESVIEINRKPVAVQTAKLTGAGQNYFITGFLSGDFDN